MLLLNIVWEGVLVFELYINMRSVLLKSTRVVQQLWQDQHQGRVATGLRQTAHYPSTVANLFSSLAEAAQKGKGK